MRSSRCARRSRRIRCRKMFHSRKARASARHTRPRIEGCCSARSPSRAKLCWCTARVGGVGTAAVQLARAHGLRVLGTAGSDEGLKLAREQGAHEVFDHRAPEHFEQVMKATGGHGGDVIVEMLANVNLGNDITILAKDGRVVII